MRLNKFKIVIPSYNNEEWYEYNLASIINQSYTNYDVLYIDDCSTDNTYQKVIDVVGDLPNWKVVKNPVNKRRGYNVSPYNPDIITFVDSDDDILMFVDGDDWLYEESTLSKMNEYYNQHDVWMTYGQYVNYPSLTLGIDILHGTSYSSQTHKHKQYRSDVWRASHLRTFKWHLYKQIKQEDLVFHKTNEHYIYAEDLATSYPCMEMAGPNKIGVVDFLTYVYNSSERNRQRIVNDLERDPNGYEIEMKSREFDIRNKKPYDTIKSPYTITSKLSGGLGNMLFQVAAGFALAKKHNATYRLYPEHSATLHTHPKTYLTSIFSRLIPISNLDNFDILKESGFEFSPFDKEIQTNCVLDGHFQSFKYFVEYIDDIKKLFAPTDSIITKLGAKYAITDSVSLHVRRGDYLSLSNYHYNLHLDYYKNALDFVGDQNVLVFSDDIAWCKQHFKGERFTFVEGNTDLEDFYLMSMCSHNIIANSTFSWWAAMLNNNPNKIVVCPDKWFGPLNESLNTFDLIPSTWTCLSEEMPKIEINLFDNSFNHLHKPNGRFSSVHNKICESVKFTTKKTEHDGISLFTDQYLNSPIVEQVKSACKVGWLLEARGVDSKYYDQFEEYAYKYSYVLTHDQELLDKYPDKTKKAVFGGTWIKTQNYGIHRKTKNVSMIYSHKTQLEGHRLRHQIAKVAKDVDLYGDGSTNPITHKEQALLDYRYSIVIENVKAQNYFTEKLVDCLIVGTIPIYWGCPNVGDYFDIKGLIVVNSVEDMLNALSNLTERHYNSKLSHIKNNLQLAKQYATTEDWLYRNVFMA